MHQGLYLSQTLGEGCRREDCDYALGNLAHAKYLKQMNVARTGHRNCGDFCGDPAGRLRHPDTPSHTSQIVITAWFSMKRVSLADLSTAASGAGGQEFKSPSPDQFIEQLWRMCFRKARWCDPGAVINGES